jgi:hypothetical protein
LSVESQVADSGKFGDFAVVAFGDAEVLVSDDAVVLDKSVAASNNAVVVNLAVVVYCEEVFKSAPPSARSSGVLLPIRRLVYNSQTLALSP